MSGRLEGHNVLVTGATSGLGLGAARLIAEEGGTVILAARREDELQKVADELGDSALAVQCDITSSADLDRLFAKISETVGQLHGVVANAGAPTLLEIGHYDYESVAASLALNITGTAFTVQGSLGLLVDGGSVILMSSIEGLRGSPSLGIYAASKAAQQSFARTWANELQHRRIRVNAVSPGPVFTPAFERAGATLESLDPVIASIPAGRLGTADDVANAVVFLLGEGSAWVNGHNLVVDGGQTAVV